MFWVLHKVQSDLQLIQIPQSKTIKFFTHDNSTELALVSTKTRDSIRGIKSIKSLKTECFWIPKKVTEYSIKYKAIYN